MDSKWLYRVTLLAASLFLSACARDVTSPGASNTTARPATVAAGGTYLVGFASTSVPDGFAGAVSALGGTVRVTSQIGCVGELPGDRFAERTE